MDSKVARVVKGEGFFHAKKAQYSQETQELLRVLMEESKLSIVQRNHIQRCVSKGEPLPPPLEPPQPNTTSSHVIIRPCSVKRRTHQEIIRSGAYEREKFTPLHPKVDKEKAKEDFQSIMAYGKVVPQTPKSVAQKVKSRLKPKKQEVQPLDKHERFMELMEEIRERTEFLEEMRELGLESKYKPGIVQEVDAKVRQLETLDRQRTLDYQEFLRERTSGLGEHQPLRNILAADH